MKRAIATLASLAVVATAGPIGGVSAAAVDGQPSKFSERFLTSLEEVNADAVVETNYEEETPYYNNALIEEGDDRRRLSWWSFALMLLGPCDPNKPHCPPHPHHDDGSSGGNTNANGNANAGGSGLTEGYDTQKAKITPGTAPFVYIIAAAAAAIAAMAALAVAAKRRRKPNYHQLRGSVKNRMNLFSGFANKCFEDRTLSAAQSLDGLQVV